MVLGRTCGRIFLVAASLWCALPGLAAVDKPNVILFFTDDQGWTDTSVRMIADREDSRSDFYRTPALETRGTDDYLIDDTVFPRMMFIEKLYNRDPTNWWIPNHRALEPLLRSAGLKVVARPHSQLIVAEPEEYFGKVTYKKLVFPRYGKRDGPRHPGPQRVPPALWQELLDKADSDL